jgi:hypothetical protein
MISEPSIVEIAVNGSQASVNFVWIWEAQSIMKQDFNIKKIRCILLLLSGCNIHNVFSEIKHCNKNVLSK